MRVRPCGDSAVLIDVLPSDAESAGTDILHAVLRLHVVVQSWELPGIVDIVPAAQTLLIQLDTAQLSPKEIAARLSQADFTSPANRARERSRISIPVTYDGPDLASLADLLDMTPEALVRAHTGTTWTAAFGGFAPGFTYLVAESPLPRVPRLTSPRPTIPAGSVGLAGDFSGVYPQVSPGGWQLIGSTTEMMWNPDNDERPALISPGDLVTFVEVN